MMAHKTVLVVGAGSSVPYGFPSGLDLVGRIEAIGFVRQGDTTRGRNPLATTILNLGYKSAEIKRFQERLRQSRTFSVDAFLEMHPEHVELGKLLIAAILVPCEDAKVLFAVAEDWYRYVTNCIADNIRARLKEPLVVLTYNYDRSLEHYFYTVLQARLNVSDEDMPEVMKPMTIIHLHGALGSLPWQKQMNGGIARLYEPTGDLQAVAREIAVIHEDRGDTAEYGLARRHLRDAKKVIFLGFGYHQPNLSRLRFAGWPHEGRDTMICGTSFGLAEGEKIHARRLIGRDKVDLVDMRCNEFVRHIAHYLR